MPDLDSAAVCSMGIDKDKATGLARNLEQLADHLQACLTKSAVQTARAEQLEIENNVLQKKIGQEHGQYVQMRMKLEATLGQLNSVIRQKEQLAAQLKSSRSEKNMVQNPLDDRTPGSVLNSTVDHANDGVVQGLCLELHQWQLRFPDKVAEIQAAAEDYKAELTNAE
eukprot:gene3312-3816_t